MSFVTLLCTNCGHFHGSVLAMDEAPNNMNFTSLDAANVNFSIGPQPSVRKLVSAREAMAITKDRYKETLEYLA
jgi:hypothetical protein